jgi:hypothetical protein
VNTVMSLRVPQIGGGGISWLAERAISLLMRTLLYGVRCRLSSKPELHM